MGERAQLAKPLGERLLEAADGYERLAQMQDKENPEPDAYCSAWGGDGSRNTATLLREAATELADYEGSFDLFHRATLALTAAWHEAHPDQQDVLPDTSKMCAWAAERLAQLQEALERVRDRVLLVGEKNRAELHALARRTLGEPTGDRKVLTRKEGKDLYAEGLQTGMDLGRKLGGGE
jgi:hypothetical protein